MQQRSLTIALGLKNPARARSELMRLAAVTTHIDGIAQPEVFHGVGIHFARLVSIEEPVDSPYASWLLLETNFDASDPDADRAISAHLTELAELKGQALQPLLSACHGFDVGLGPAELAARLREHVVQSTAEYQGHGGRDLTRIELEAGVRDLCMDALTQVPDSTRDPQLVYDSLRTTVMTQAARAGLAIDFEAAAPAQPDPAERARKLRQRWQPWARELLLASPLLPCLPYALVRELLDRPYCMQEASEHRGPHAESLLVANLAAEDHFAQNALTHVVPVKAGFMRHFMLRTAHRYVHALAAHHFNFVEQLGGIPSIHFAKWLLIDEGKRLLFFSNYDGSWESYLGDFVDQAAIGLNLAWTCTEGYPRTRALAFGGAKDEERFKAWGRAHQRPTQVFYSAYPNRSVSNINNNSWLRHGLHRSRPSDLDAFLRRLT